MVLTSVNQVYTNNCFLIMQIELQEMTSSNLSWKWSSVSESSTIQTSLSLFSTRHSFQHIHYKICDIMSCRRIGKPNEMKAKLYLTFAYCSKLVKLCEMWPLKWTLPATAAVKISIDFLRNSKWLVNIEAPQDNRVTFMHSLSYFHTLT